MTNEHKPGGQGQILRDWANDVIGDRSVEEAAEGADLTEVQQERLQRYMDGLSTGDIANQDGISITRANRSVSRGLNLIDKHDRKSSK